MRKDGERKSPRHSHKEKFTSQFFPYPEKLPLVAPDAADRPLEIVSMDHTDIDESLLVPRIKARKERLWRAFLQSQDARNLLPGTAGSKLPEVRYGLGKSQYASFLTASKTGRKPQSVNLRLSRGGIHGEKKS